MTEKAAGDQSIQEILERRSREEIGSFFVDNHRTALMDTTF